MKIQEVIDRIRENQIGVMSIVAEEPWRYSDAKDTETWAGTLFTKKNADRQPGDEIIQTGNKETNLSEVERTLRYLIGKGPVYVKLLNPNLSMYGEVEA